MMSKQPFVKTTELPCSRALVLWACISSRDTSFASLGIIGSHCVDLQELRRLGDEFVEEVRADDLQTGPHGNCEKRAEETKDNAPRRQGDQNEERVKLARSPKTPRHPDVIL